MRRTLDQALLDLRAYIASSAGGARRPPAAVFVYAPEWEAAMLARFPSFVSDCEKSGWPLDLIDVGQGFRADLARRKGLISQLEALEATNLEQLRHDLGVLAQRYLTSALRGPSSASVIARLLVNTGPLATFTSYSSIADDLSVEVGPGNAPTVIIAFPGEGDEHSLNLLRLRADTNYRIPRI